MEYCPSLKRITCWYVSPYGLNNSNTLNQRSHREKITYFMHTFTWISRIHKSIVIEGRSEVVKILGIEGKELTAGRHGVNFKNTEGVLCNYFNFCIKIIIVLQSLPLKFSWILLYVYNTLEKAMASHSSVLAWRIPGTEEPGGLQSMGSHRVGHDWRDLAAAAAYNILANLI